MQEKKQGHQTRGSKARDLKSELEMKLKTIFYSRRPEQPRTSERSLESKIQTTKLLKKQS